MFDYQVYNLIDTYTVLPLPKCTTYMGSTSSTMYNLHGLYLSHNVQLSWAVPVPQCTNYMGGTCPTMYNLHRRYLSHNVQLTWAVPVS